MITSEHIEAALTALNPSDLAVRDDSHLHRGHAGAASGGHFHVRIVSTQFAGLSRVARHRLVYDAVASLIPQGIHALSIEALTP
jgi:BolA protein